MPAILSSTVFHQMLLLATLAAAWAFTIPALMTPSTFLALLGMFAALAWVLKTTYASAQPASSLAQSLHDRERAASTARTREIR